MSRAARARKAVLTAHKVAGTYTPVRLVRHAVSDVICQQARIPHDRKTLYFESSGSAEARTSKRNKSADTHHIAASATRSRIVRGITSLTDARSNLAPAKIVSPSRDEVVRHALERFRAASHKYLARNL